MIFTATRADGTLETRRHVPYRLKQSGNSWIAYHAETGFMQGHFDSEESARRNMDSMTEAMTTKRPVLIAAVYTRINGVIRYQYITTTPDEEK